MNQIKYFNASHDKKRGTYKTNRFQRDPGFSEILDSRLTRENMVGFNLVISQFWFIRITSLFLHFYAFVVGFFSASVSYFYVSLLRIFTYMTKKLHS